MEFRIVNRPNFTKKSLHLTYFRGKVGGYIMPWKGRSWINMFGKNKLKGKWVAERPHPLFAYDFDNLKIYKYMCV